MKRAALLLALVGCSMGGERIEDHPCPPNGTQWTYENFGASFHGPALRNLSRQLGGSAKRRVSISIASC